MLCDLSNVSRLCDLRNSVRQCATAIRHPQLVPLDMHLFPGESTRHDDGGIDIGPSYSSRRDQTAQASSRST